jgi:hypothetical protein
MILGHSDHKGMTLLRKAMCISSKLYPFGRRIFTKKRTGNPEFGSSLTVRRGPLVIKRDGILSRNRSVKFHLAETLPPGR